MCAPVHCLDGTTLFLRQMRSFLLQINIKSVQKLWIIFAIDEWHRVHPKKLWPWHCWPTNTIWPSLVHVPPEKPTVLVVPWSLVYCDVSMFCQRLRNGAKTCSDYGWTSPNTTLKWSHGCAYGRVWAIAAPIARIAFSYPNIHVKCDVPA